MLRVLSPIEVGRRAFRTLFASRGARANAADAFVEIAAARRRRLASQT